MTKNDFNGFCILKRLVAKEMKNSYAFWKKIMVSMATESLENSHIVDLVDFGCHGNMKEWFDLNISQAISQVLIRSILVASLLSLIVFISFT